MKHAASDSGNVLFLILIGIALFAAFTMAVTRTSRTDNGSSAQQDKLAATRIIQYGDTLKGAVDQLRTNGIGESAISFANGTVLSYGTAGTSPSAEIFNTSGGNIVYEAPDTSWLDGIHTALPIYGQWYFTGGSFVRDVGSPVGSDCAAAGCVELIAMLPYIRKEICQKINSAYGIKAPGGAPPVNADASIASPYFTGTYSITDQFGDDSAVGLMNGRMGGCVEGGGTFPPSGSYVYYRVLIAR